MRERACEAGPVAGRVLTSCPAFTGVNKLFGVYWLGFAKKFKTVSSIPAAWGIQGETPCCLLGTYAKTLRVIAGQSTSPAGASPGKYRKDIYKVFAELRGLFPTNK